MKTKTTFVSIFALSMTLSACSTQSDNSSVSSNSSNANPTLFTNVQNAIPFEDRKRRKFDNAVISDLDQDGLQDIIINEHGREMFIFWNNDGTFERGPKIANGDVHGAAVGDFDKSGKVDIIITQGGGDGANPRRPLWVEVARDRQIERGTAFDYFEPGRGRSAKFIPSPVDGDLNLIVTGFATPEQMSVGANHYYDNQGGGKFKFQSNLPNASRLGFRTTVTDFNSDGIFDILFFGAGQFVAAQGLKDGSFVNATDTVFGDLSYMKDVHTITEIDFDNDGDLDLFFTRAEFQFDIESFYDAKNKRFAFLSFRKNFLFEDLKIEDDGEVEGDLIIENLQRSYPHYDLFMGADKTPYVFKNDPHGHQDIRIKPSEAKGWPEGETKGGLYVGYLGEGLWRVGGQTRSRWAGVFHNVVSNPNVEAQADLPAVLLENQGGRFVDATQKLGIDIQEQTTGSTAADFDNDGFMDIAVLRYGSMAEVNEHILLMNKGGTVFERTNSHGIVADEVGTTGGSITPFDYNADGVMDIIFSNERGRWHLLKNTIPSVDENNYLVVNVGQAVSGQSPIGAKLSVFACGQSYYRTVGSTSAAYSQPLNLSLHLGIGKCEVVDKVVVTWPDGTRLDRYNQSVNNHISVP